MSDPKNEEGSMEEILASIRRIIADDSSTKSKPEPEPQLARTGPAAEPDDVLVLTEVVSMEPAAPPATTGPATSHEPGSETEPAPVFGRATAPFAAAPETPPGEPLLLSEPAPAEEPSSWTALSPAPESQVSSDHGGAEPQEPEPTLLAEPWPAAETRLWSEKPPDPETHVAPEPEMIAAVMPHAAAEHASVAQPEAAHPPPDSEAHPAEPIAAPESSSLPEPSFMSESAAATVPSASPAAPPGLSASGRPTGGESEGLVSDWVAAASSDALAALAEASARDAEARRSSGQPPVALGDLGRTLEDLVKELVRPMLRGWIDQNLPGIVERLVQQEVEKLSSRAGRR